MGICVTNLPANEVAEVGRIAEDHGYAEVFVPDGARGGTADANGRLTGRDAFAGFAAMFTTDVMAYGGGWAMLMGRPRSSHGAARRRGGRRSDPQLAYS